MWQKFNFTALNHSRAGPSENFLMHWVCHTMEKRRPIPVVTNFFLNVQISSEVYSCCHTLPVVYISPYHACTSTSVMQTPSLPSSTDQVVATLNRIWISPDGICASSWRAQPWRDNTAHKSTPESVISESIRMGVKIVRWSVKNIVLTLDSSTLGKILTF